MIGYESGQSKRSERNQLLLRAIVALHEKYPAFGLDSIYHILQPIYHCSRGRVHRLMKSVDIRSKRKKAYKATTNSKHDNPISPNLLQRNFNVSRPNAVWVGDITYVPTGEGWLYVAIVKDLCTKKVVGYSFSERSILFAYAKSHAGKVNQKPFTLPKRVSAYSRGIN